MTPSLAVRRLPVSLLTLAAIAACNHRVPSPSPSQTRPTQSASENAIVPNHRSVVPSGPARVVLVADRARYFLGENVLVHYCLENIGTSPLTISVGGDYRGSSRSLRFHVTVTGEDGKVAEDPDPSGFNLGGLGYSPTIAPGDHWCQSLPLLRYARIDNPGAYTISVTHDLGWGEDAAPTGTLTIRFAAPTARDAEAVVDAALALPADKSSSAGKARAPYADLGLLRLPIYLPALSARVATRGDRAREIIEAMGAIESKEATAALIALAQSPDGAIALAAAKALGRRLPDIEVSKRAAAGTFITGRDAEKKRLVETSYGPEHAAASRAIGARLVASNELATSSAGAYILQCVGERADLSALASALDRAMFETTRPRLPGRDFYETPRGVCAVIVHAARVLAERGLTPTERPKTAGEIGVWLVAFQADSGSRPLGWEGTLAKAATHPFPYLREIAMNAVSRPVPAQIVTLMPRLLGDVDRDVQIAACQAAERIEETSLVPSVLGAFKMARDPDVVRACDHAAWMLGARFEALQIAADRLDEAEIGNQLRSSLAQLLGDTDGHSADAMSPSQAAAAKARWRAFLAANEPDVRRGVRYSTRDPKIVPEMFPAMRLHLRDGTSWP